MQWNLLIFLLLTVHIISTGKVPPKKDESTSKTKLQLINESEDCSKDARRLCGHIEALDDLTVLNCLQDNEEVMKSISTKCQHFLWSYKKKLTTSDYLNDMTNKMCGSSLQNIEECKSSHIGHRVPCLLDRKAEITDSKCHNFLNKVGVIVFADYHLIYKFVDRCESDIVQHKCGRLNKNGDALISETEDSKELQGTLADYVTTQADTLDCLVRNISNLSKPCQHEILRLSELQSDDYHLNRKLYMSCREDRDELCARVQSGEGRVYRCLMKHKFSDKMSKQCQQQLSIKQQIESKDVKANYPLFTSCKQEIEKHKCIPQSSPNDDDKVLQMSGVLLCLEDVETRGGKIDPVCKAELTERRQEMIEDIRLSPEVIVACVDDIKNNCDETDRQPGSVLHCLMKLASGDEQHLEGKITKQCRVALTQMLMVANPTEDIMLLDPVMQRACSSSMVTLCENVNSKVEAFQCLMQNIASPEMAPDCRSNLTGILYFMSFNFKIDASLRKSCHGDAMKLCNGPKTFKETAERTESENKMEYYCMYKYYRDDRINLDIAAAKGISPSKVERFLSADCSNEIYRLLLAQSIDVKIDPIIFDNCFEDLSKLCMHPNDRGREHECLQNKFSELQPKCKNAVIDYSKLEEVDVRFNHKLTEACLPMTKLFCDKKSPEEMLTCLIRHKRHKDMSTPCKAAIEHVQIMSLEEYHIDHRFANFCNDEINKYCRDELQAQSGSKVISKVSIVSCLSKTIVKEIVAGKENPLSPMCRQQFSFEVLQRSDSVVLDRNLLRDCKSDITDHCKNVSNENIPTCLRRNQDSLTDKCHRRIFQRERMESLNAKFDGRLLRVCSQMINEYCHDVSGPRLFQCLHKQMDDVEFDDECRQLIYLRLERRMNDIRLNPGLLKDCGHDIKQHCNKEPNENLEPKSGIEFEGVIIQCLKDTFSNNSELLKPSCRQRILKIIIEANAHLRLDPILRRKCMPAIRKLCNDELMNQYDSHIGTVQDCLKHKFLKKEIDSPQCEHEIYRLLKEGRADVHVDSQLFTACEDAIMKLCSSEKFGDGRKMSCLLYFADDKKGSALLNGRCLDMIKERREMWSLSAVMEPQSFQDIVEHINQSSMRTYLFSMMGLMIFALILLGICCGRITKRVPVDLKNK